MAESQGVTQADNFAEASRDFVEWFRNAEGTRFSDKIELADLRDREAGRGVGAGIEVSVALGANKTGWAGLRLLPSLSHVPNIILTPSLVATQAIAEDEELFAIPRELVLRTATTDYIPAGALPDSGTWLPLIIVTVQQLLSKESSKWHPYFRVLPSSFDTLMFWNDAELAELQASAVLKKIGKENADKEFREKVWPCILSDPDFFDFKGEKENEWEEHAVRMCHYAGSLIMAYAFDIDRDDGGSDEAEAMLDTDGLQSDDEDNPLKGLVPFADMLNADADRNNARLFQEDNYLIMKAIKPIKAGEECFNDYGPLPRSELLRMYGYVTHNYKQYDVVDFEHGLLENLAGAKANSNDWQKRMEQLDEIGVLDDGYSFPRPRPDQKLEDAIPGELHMVLRGLCTDSKAKMQKKAPLTVEEAALLSSAAVKKLSEYPTSLQQDRAIIDIEQEKRLVPAGVSPKRYKMAVEVRIGEKEILHQILALCEEYIKMQSKEKKRRHSNGEAGTTSKLTKKMKK